MAWHDVYCLEKGEMNTAQYTCPYIQRLRIGFYESGFKYSWWVGIARNGSAWAVLQGIEHGMARRLGSCFYIYTLDGDK